MEKPLILVTNDDSIYAPGLRLLIEIARKYGEVMVVAPDKPQSGMSHAITITIPLRLKLIAQSENYQEYNCNGTPVDCVKLGMDKLFPRKPDLILSGINHGSNSSINVIYSGTMSAAMEGALSNIPALGFSLVDYALDACMDGIEPYIEKIITQTLQYGLPEQVCLNINIPILNGTPIQGIKICKQAKAEWKECFDIRKDPHDREYYWLYGNFNNLDDSKESDEWALQNHYISIVPIKIDLTAYETIPQLKKWDLHV